MKYLDKVDLFLTVGYSDTVLYSPARSQTLYTSQRLVRYSKKQKKKSSKDGMMKKEEDTDGLQMNVYCVD